MGFFLFLLVTAALLIRPQEQVPELRDVRIYETLIILCFAFSFNGVIAQFTLKSLETRPISVGIFGLLFAVLLSHLSHGNLVGARDNGFEFFKVVVYYVLLVGNVSTVLRLRIFIYSLGSSAVLFVFLAVLQYHEVITLPVPEPTGEVAWNAKSLTDATQAFVEDMDWNPETGRMEVFRRLRGTGIFRDPNDISLLMTMGLFIALYGLTDRDLSVLRWSWLGVVMFFLYALSLTYSRGGVVSMLAGCMALLYARFGWRGMALWGAPLVPVAIFMFGGRLATFSASEGTGQTRIQIWSDGLQAMMESPVFGVGMNEIGNAIGKAAHNSFLHAYAELGLLGGTMFFGVFFFALVMLQRLLKYRQAVADPELRRMLPYLAAILVSYGVGILSLSRVESVPTYLTLALVTVACNMAVVYTPALALRLDGRLMQKLALATVAFLAASYMFVRVFKA